MPLWPIITGAFLLLVILFIFYRLPSIEAINRMVSKDSPIDLIEISTIFGNKRIIKFQQTAKSTKSKHLITELIEIKCPITASEINTFHLAPSPSSSSDDLELLKVGEKVIEGQSLCAIEFTEDNNEQVIEIKAEKSGKIFKIQIENGSKVTQGQILLFIETQS